MLKIENGKPIVYKESKTMGTLIMKEIPKVLAKDMCIKYHYAHKWNEPLFGIVNVGIFKASEPDKCLGVASFGNLMHQKSYTMFSDGIKQDEILELNRLWIDDCLGKNSETMLLSASWIILRYYKKIKIVQSFADGRLGCGTIYKASNFKYYGYSEPLFFKDTVTNEIYHEVILSNTHRPFGLVKSMSALCQGNLNAFATRSYRYIYILDKSVKIKLKEQSYPEYHIGTIDIDVNELVKDGMYKFALFRAYIMSKYINDVDNSTYYIASYILNNWDEEDIIKTLDSQIKGGFIERTYGETQWYQDLVKKRNYLELLKEDANNKPQKVVYEDLF